MPPLYPCAYPQTHPQLPPPLGTPMNVEEVLLRTQIPPDNLTIASSSLILQFYKVFKKTLLKKRKRYLLLRPCLPRECRKSDFREAVILIGRHHFVYVFVEKIPHVLAFRWKFRGIERVHKKKSWHWISSQGKYPTLVYNMSLLRAQYQLLEDKKKNKTFLAIELFYLCF